MQIMKPFLHFIVDCWLASYNILFLQKRLNGMYEVILKGW